MTNTENTPDRTIDYDAGYFDNRGSWRTGPDHEGWLENAGRQIIAESDPRESLQSLMIRTPSNFWRLMEAAEIEAGDWYEYTDNNGDRWMTTDPNWEGSL